MGCGLGVVWGGVGDVLTGFQELHLPLLFHQRGSDVSSLTLLSYFPFILGNECLFGPGRHSLLCVSLNMTPFSNLEAQSFDYINKRINTSELSLHI